MFGDTFGVSPVAAMVVTRPRAGLGRQARSAGCIPLWRLGLDMLHLELGAYSPPTAVLKDLNDGRISGEDVPKSVIAVATVAEEQMGGTSGALYSCVPLPLCVFFFRLPILVPRLLPMRC